MDLKVLFNLEHKSNSFCHNFLIESYFETKLASASVSVLCDLKYLSIYVWNCYSYCEIT